MQCDFCGLEGATVEHATSDGSGDPSVIFVSCEDAKACKDRVRFEKALTAPEPWHTMQSTVSRFVNLTI